MSVAEDVAPDVDRLTRDPFDRMAAGVDRRIDLFDDETMPGKFVGSRCAQWIATLLAELRIQDERTEIDKNAIEISTFGAPSV
jgi:hypothetical protein